LVYKLLAARRKCGSPQEIRLSFEFVYQNIEPIDAAIVGMYPHYSEHGQRNLESLGYAL
jgi:hypothetical protein